MKVIEIKWILLILLLMGGCGNYNYIPNTHNVPLLKEEGDIHLDFSCSLPEILGWEGQAAFAAIKHFGIIANGLRHNHLSFDDESENCSGHLIEGGAGTFIPLYNNLVFETYAGFGFGKVQNKYTYSRLSILRFNRYFLQPSVGYTSKYFDAALALRINGLRYHNNYYSSLYSDPYQRDYIERNPFSILIEPGVILRIGPEYFKFQIKTGYSGNILNPDLWQVDFYFSAGIYLNLSNNFFTAIKPASARQ